MIFTRLAAVFMLLFSPSACQVGRDVGRAAVEDYPHQVLIVVKGENHRVYKPCTGSGTLISEQWVLTAAHNFDSDKDIGKAVGAEVRVPTKGYRAEAAAFYTHPTYDVDQALEDGEEYDFCMIDIALVRLKAPFMDGSRPAVIRTASLPRRNEEIEDFSNVRFAGYGTNDYNNEDVLYEGTSVKLPIYYCATLDDHLPEDEYHSTDAAEIMFDFFENPLLNDQDKRNMKRFYQDNYRNIICTGVNNPHDIGSYNTIGDSGCGLFKTDDLNTVHGVMSTSNYSRFDHDQQFTRPTQWVKVSESLDFISWTMERHSDKNFGRQKGSLEFALVFVAALCVYFL